MVALEKSRVVTTKRSSEKFPKSEYLGSIRHSRKRFVPFGEKSLALPSAACSTRRMPLTLGGEMV